METLGRSGGHLQDEGAVNGVLREIKVKYGRGLATVLQVKPDDAVTELHT